MDMDLFFEQRYPPFERGLGNKLFVQLLAQRKEMKSP